MTDSVLFNEFANRAELAIWRWLLPSRTQNDAKVAENVRYCTHNETDLVGVSRRAK
jgi:hypothetical protein